jgi:hypothetical protein
MSSRSKFSARCRAGRFAAIAVTALTIPSSLIAPVWAGGLDAARVDREAKWLVHLDVEAFKRSEFGRALLESPPTPMNAALRSIRGRFDVDPVRDVDALTVFAGADFGLGSAGGSSGGSDGGSSAVAVVVGGSKLDSMFARIATMPEHQIVANGDSIRSSGAASIAIHCWKAGERTQYAVRWKRPGDAGPTVLFGQRRESIDAAIQVLSGQRPALSLPSSSASGATELESVLSQRSTSGTVLLAATGDFGRLISGPVSGRESSQTASASDTLRSALAKEVRGVRLELGEERVASSDTESRFPAGTTVMFFRGWFERRTPSAATTAETLERSGTADPAAANPQMSTRLQLKPVIQQGVMYAQRIAAMALGAGGENGVGNGAEGEVWESHLSDSDPKAVTAKVRLLPAYGMRIVRSWLAATGMRTEADKGSETPESAGGGSGAGVR